MAFDVEFDVLGQWDGVGVLMVHVLPVLRLVASQHAALRPRQGSRLHRLCVGSE